MMRSFLIPVLVFCLFNGYAQELQFIKTVEIESPSDVSHDQAGNIYVATYNGDIVKYNHALEERIIFSPSNPSTTTILEAWHGLRIFSFQRDLQQYRLINRNLSLHEDYSFPADLFGYIEIATPSFDNNIWVIDQIDFSLKKFDIHSKQIQTRTALNILLNPDNYELLHCREYQNKLFVSTRKYGILIFDNFGNYLKTYQNQGVSFFNFWGDFVYFIEGNVLVKRNLYTEEVERVKLPGDGNWKFALINKDKILLFSNNRLSLYR